jgi:spore maturation protein CgeB
MKILYCGLRWDYAKEEQGDSYEHNNIELGLREWCMCNGHQLDVYYPDSAQLSTENWYQSQSEKLTEGYDVVFHVEFNDQYDLPLKGAAAALRRDVPVICWSSDASYRFHDWILPRKDRYSHFITTHSKTVDWYKKNGMTVIKSQWASSPLYKKHNLQKHYDISFIGQCHGHYNGGMLRRDIVDTMFKVPLDVHVWGNYWDKPIPYKMWHGYAPTYQKIVEIINQSDIGLNLLNGWATHQLGQIKGRTFEIPACGTMQLSTYADDLETYFEPDKEIVIANSMNELCDKAQYYLKHPEEREKIALAAYNRVQKDHLWQNRFDHIFKEVGLI